MRALYYFWIAVGSALILQVYSFTVLLILANCFAVLAEYAYSRPWGVQLTWAISMVLMSIMFHYDCFTKVSS